MKKRKNKQRRFNKQRQQNISEKATKILNLFFIVLSLFLLRVWHLSVVQHEKKVEDSFRPQRRVVIEPAERGTIRDRFNLPLALNKVQYNAAISYAQILEVPRVSTIRDKDGVKKRVYKRKEYVEEMVQMLAKELHLDPQLIEDQIYSKAAIFPNVPFVVKANLTESEYYRLKMLEREWTGVKAQIVSRRYYPQGPVAGDIVGYLGAISRKNYDSIAQEIRELKNYLKEREEGEDPPLPEGIESSWKVRYRLKDLQEKSYTIQDDIGRSGIEKVFEEDLRGYFGKKEYLADAKGYFLRELPGVRKAVPGQRVILSISSELQSFAEKLLIQNEHIRESVSREYDRKKGVYRYLKQPWIKGGAIVVMEPTTGEVLALASYPRFNPNDFINTGDPEIDKERDKNIYHWLEIEHYIASLWDQQVPLKKESLENLDGEIEEETLYVNWDNYLKLILPEEHPITLSLKNVIQNVGNAILLQQCFETLLSISSDKDPWALMNYLYPSPKHKTYKPSNTIENNELLDKQNNQVQELISLLNYYLEGMELNYDKMLMIDLCRVAVEDNLFSSDLFPLVQDQTLSFYRKAEGAYLTIREFVKSASRQLFHELDFPAWREHSQKKFLKEKRKEEKANKHYSRPYLDYLNKEEERLFELFWSRHQYSLIMVLLMGETGFSDLQETSMDDYITHFKSWHKELDQGAHHSLSWKKEYDVLHSSLNKLGPVLAYEYLHTFRSYYDLDRPLLGKYRNVKSKSNAQTEKELASAFYPYYGFSFSRSHAYRQATIQGSIFKIVTAYEALVQRYYKMKDHDDIDDLNPLTIIDKVHRPKGRRSPPIVAYTLDGKAIPQIYKGGRILPSLRKNIGEIDLIRALETSSNSYFSLLAGDVIEEPEDLNRAAEMFSFGHKTGIDLPGEYPGRLPRDLEENRSGLYSYSCGQHSLVVTPLQTAVMLSSIANGGEVLKPQIARMLVGKEPVRSNENVFNKERFFYKDTLSLIGINFPLFSAAEQGGRKNQMTLFSPEIAQQVALPASVRTYLLRGMRQVVKGRHESVIRNYYDHLFMIQDYARFKKDIVGKSSTSEVVERIDLDLSSGTETYNHCWFGAISFDPKTQFTPDEKLEYYGEFGKPELVVIVFLRFGDYGKEAAPLATQIIKKWRELKEKHSI